METINEILSWFATGRGRYAAAALLFLTMQAIKTLPIVKEWLAKDSGKWLGVAWTTKRKKMLATLVISLTPVVPMLASDLPLEEVLNAAAEILAEAMGLKLFWNVVRKQPPSNDNAGDGDKAA